MAPPAGDVAHLFDFPPDDCIYLNAAGMTPLPTASRRAGLAAVAAKSAPWVSLVDHGPDGDVVGDVRRHFAALVGAAARDIAICPSTAFSVSTAARNIDLARGRPDVLVLAHQMASSVMPWQDACARAGGRLVVVPRSCRATRDRGRRRAQDVYFWVAANTQK